MAISTVAGFSILAWTYKTSTPSRFARPADQTPGRRGWYLSAHLTDRLTVARNSGSEPLEAPRSPAASLTVVGGDSAHRRNAAATPESTGMCSPVVCARSPPASTKTAAATCSGSTSFWSSVRWA